jgi:hypothetical protein
MHVLDLPYVSHGIADSINASAIGMRCGCSMSQRKMECCDALGARDGTINAVGGWRVRIRVLLGCVGG